MELAEVERQIQALLCLDDDPLNLIVGQAADPVCRVFARIVLHVKLGEYKAAEETLTTAVMRTEVKKTIQRTLNENFLKPLSLEWAKPGIMRTFRFWSREEKTSYLQIANEVTAALRSSGLDACLGFGSVLSFVRDRDFIPHDDDLDVIVAMPRGIRDFKSGLEAVREVINAAGFAASGDFYSHHHVLKPGAKRVVDVFVGIREEDCITWFPGPRKTIKESVMFDPIECSFMGASALFPRNPFTYLEMVYGPDWFDPKPLWNHTWDVKVVADLIGR